MFAGVSAFPLSPLHDDRVDADALGRLVAGAAAAGVDSVGVPGSTGVAQYLTRDERRRVVVRAVAEAGDVPVLAGIGALRTSDVLAHAHDAAEAGAAGILLVPTSYHPLTDDEVVGLYADVTERVPLPLVVYENRRTTSVAFTDDLLARVTALPHVVAVKVPGAPGDVADVTARLAHLRTVVPAHVGIGMSGDAFAATALVAGVDTWWSVLAGVLPGTAVRLARAARDGDAATLSALTDALAPLLHLVGPRGGVRVAAALAEHRGLVDGPCLPRPLHGLDAAERATAVASAEAAERV
ncbi:dihydrodipicolinate synthase family protein [Cellulomonas shaoxiangyii]|uniref:Dihydrodipicolinate synthase family protein n=1 Tax=Cellulomonas shaoxiangyii TaxID=2566013 RepID=A0A4P7SE63_9CELL|nr:dihydrodipicolinate synthase family protein [Cellulomonas shaoxiangyii]QCB92312.1 dihydrodipicolinate synthase family protein [Cellulomonas shaoxiangyii]TGY86293.1 dihydrodipicolinate synthase family protein [Cellulomonas shaoxiangyii]